MLTNQIKLNSYICQQEIITRIKLLSKSSLASIRILDSLIFYGNINDEIFPQQKNIAKRAGVTRETVCRYTSKKLYELGLIYKRNNGKRKSCNYYLNPLLNLPYIRKSLRDIISSFKWWTQKSLLSNSKITKCGKIYSRLLEYVTPIINKKNFIYKKKQLLESHSLSKENGIAAKFTKRKKGRCLSIIDNLQFGNPTIRNRLELLKKIKGLNEAAIIQLSSFPEKAILFAANRMCYKFFEIKDPFSYITQMCRIYCQENKLGLDLDHIPQVIMDAPEFKLKPDSFDEILIHGKSTQKNSSYPQNIANIKAKSPMPQSSSTSAIQQRPAWQQEKIKQKNPLEELKKWENHVESPDGKNAATILGEQCFISGFCLIMCMLPNCELSDDERFVIDKEITRLIFKYDFLCNWYVKQRDQENYENNSSESLRQRSAQNKTESGTLNTLVGNLLEKIKPPERLV